MRNLKVVRKRRGESASGLRKQIAQLKEENAFLQEWVCDEVAACVEAQREAERAKDAAERAAKRELLVPQGLADRVIEQMVRELGRTMAHQVIAQTSDETLKHVSFRASCLLVEAMKYGYRVQEVPESIRIFAEEVGRKGDLKLSTHVNDFSLVQVIPAEVRELDRTANPGDEVVYKTYQRGGKTYAYI